MGSLLRIWSAMACHGTGWSRGREFLWIFFLDQETTSCEYSSYANYTTFNSETTVVSVRFNHVTLTSKNMAT